MNNGMILVCIDTARTYNCSMSTWIQRAVLLVKVQHMQHQLQTLFWCNRNLELTVDSSPIQ